MQLTTKRILVFLLPLQIVIVKILSLFPEFVEQYYSNGIYPFISTLLRYALGWLPFSFGDIAYILLIFLLLRFLYKALFKKKYSWKEALIEIGATLSIVYACFHILWGLNYYRMPLHSILQIEDQYDEEALIKVTEHLIEQANALHSELEQNDSVSVRIPYSKDDIFQKTVPAYQELGNTYPNFRYQPGSIKKSLLSLPLTYMGFSGYLNPVTNEAQVNALILPFKFPTTSCHEEAHQLGFAKENEANFIAVLATLASKDRYFNYSGTTFALRYCINDLYLRDEQKAICLLEKLRPGIRKNYQEVRDFWDQYQNPIEPLFKSTYDSYLKANNQPDGIETYSYVSALIVNYFKDKSFKK